MKFNKLAKDLNLSVTQLAEKVKEIIPNANGGTEVSDEQKEQIVALLQAPAAGTALSLLIGEDDIDPVLSVLVERIEQEAQRETPEQLVDQMIARYVENPADLPTDAEYREAIVTYVDLVKKRQLRRQQQSSRLRSLLSRHDSRRSAAEPLVLETFYSAEPSSSGSSVKLNGNAQPPQLSAASS